MTDKEAIQWIKSSVPLIAVTIERFDGFFEARDMAIEALEKQIPKALKERQDVDIKNLYRLHCPTCDIPLGSNNKRTGMLMMFDPYAKCCSQCGQALKVDTK